MREKLLRIREALPLPDRLLLLFMAALMAQTALGIALGGGSGAVDVIVRTAMASIFGYFLSGGRLSTSARIVIVAGVGLCSLAMLLLLLAAAPPVSDAVGSQLRDFVSGAVGFLISRGEEEK